VVSCWDDDEWERFCRASDKLPWLADPRFGTSVSRKKNERELNQLIGEWTERQDAKTVMYRLQRCGVHAAVVNTMRDLFSDPQLGFRDVWQEQVHPEIGPHHYRMTSYQLSETPGRIRRHAPCLGEDNETVFLGWLGLSREELEHLSQQGVLS
jgi:crotonobetainyl-CoA:carnitine CoA-transferase CaiB-like acyl-CoA transferase